MRERKSCGRGAVDFRSFPAVCLRRFSSAMPARISLPRRSSRQAWMKRVFRPGSTRINLRLARILICGSPATLERCSFFVPIISQQTEARLRDAWFRREWSRAAQRAEGIDPNKEFIIPVVVDDTMSFSHLDPLSSNLHQQRLPGGKVTADLLRNPHLPASFTIGAALRANLGNDYER